MNDKLKEVYKIFAFALKDMLSSEEPESSEGERPIDEEPLSVCCSAPFTYPGWPDSDFCSKCHEHAGVDEDE